MTAEGVTGQKRLPERDFMPTISTNSGQRRGVTHMPSAGVPTSGPSVQYGVHTDHKTCSGAHVDVGFLHCFFFLWLLRVTQVKNACPIEGITRRHPPTAVDLERSYTRPLQGSKNQRALSIFECTRPADVNSSMVRG